MGFVTVAAHVTILLTSACVTAWLAAVGLARRERPGARPFAGMMVVATVWSLGYAGGLLTPDPTLRVFWEQVQWFGISFVPPFVLLFFAEYTGFDALQRRRGVLAVSVVPAITLCLVWTNPLHSLVWVDNTLVVTDGVVTAEQEFGAWYWVHLLYTYLLIGGGGFVLLYAVRDSSTAYAPRLALLAVGLGVPLVANLASVLGYQPIEGLDMTPYVFGLTGLVFARAVFGHRLFDRTPSALRAGQLDALERLPDAVVVVDADGAVVFHNAAATAAFDGPPTLGGGPLDPPPDPGEEPVVRTVDGRTVEVVASTVEDGGGRRLGTLYRLQDVTAREARIAELSRREDALERQRAGLLELDALNRTLRTVNRVLVASRTAEEVREGVTNGLTATRWYTGAEVATATVEEPTVTTVGGDGADDDGIGEEDAIVEADGPDGTDDERADGEAVERRLAVPLRFGATDYGSLSVTSDRPDAFGEREIEVVVELARTTAMSLNAVETRATLLSDAVVELTYDVDADRSPLAAATAATGGDATLAVTSTVPVDESTLLAYVDVGGDPVARGDEATGDPDEREREREADGVDAVVDALARAEGVEAASRVGDRDAVELRLGPGAPLVVAAGHGANVVSAEATGGTATVAVETAAGSDVRRLTEALGDDGAGGGTGVTLVSKRQRAPVEPSPRGASSEPASDAGLTPRQRESLEAAHGAGYFEWPRDSTAEDVAGAMEIASSAFHSHLRKAQGKLVGWFLSREGPEGRATDADPPAQ